MLDFSSAPEPREWSEWREAPLDYAKIREAVRPYLPTLAKRWLPGGRREGHAWVARNPMRDDRRAGSFRVNLINGCWGDFAIGKTGGDVISLAAYLDGCSQSEAAGKLAAMVGLEGRP